MTKKIESLKKDLFSNLQSVNNLARIYGFSIGSDDIKQEIYIKIMLDDKAGYKACKNLAIDLCRKEMRRASIFAPGEIDIAIECNNAEKTVCIKQFIKSLSLLELAVVKKLVEGNEKKDIAKFILKSPASVSGIINELKVKLLKFI